MRKLHVFLISLYITIPCLAQVRASPDSSDPNCFREDHPDYTDWVEWGRPACWCYCYQCLGDADGIKTGPFWVAIPDLQILRSALNKIDTVLATIPNGICADFDHIKAGPFRVAIPDLNILRTYFNKFESQFSHYCPPGVFRLDCWLVDPW